MKNLFFYIVITFVINANTSCKSDDDSSTFDNTCSVENPIEDLEWLKNEINELNDDEYSYYMMGKLNGESVFYYQNCNPAINYVSMVKDCNGEIIGNLVDYPTQINDARLIWKSSKSVCEF